MPDQISSQMKSAIQNATNTLSSTFGLEEADRKLLEATLKNTATMAIETYKTNLKNYAESLYRDIVKETNSI